MPIKLENLTDRPVLLVLSNGDALRLSPGKTSVDLHETEQNNPRVVKLVQQRVLAISGGAVEQSPSAAGEPAAPAGAVTAGVAPESQVATPPPKKPKSGAHA